MQHFQHITLCYYKKGKNATETQKEKDFCSVWRKKVSKQFAKFRAGDSSLDDAPRSGRAGKVDSDQIETFTGNN